MATSILSSRWRIAGLAIACAPAGCGLLLGLDEYEPAASDGATATGTGTATSTGAGSGGGAGACEPGTTVSCYSGPMGTADVGRCKSGSQVCGEDGTLESACQGEVTPVPEACAELGDEDCDGIACSEPAWSQIYGDAASQYPVGIAGDAAGNVIFVGSFLGAVTIGSQTQVSAGERDVLAVKLDAEGKPAWSLRLGDADDQSALAMAVDGEGNTIVGGYTNNSINFGAGTVAAGLFLLKIDSAGALAWSKGFGGAYTPVIGNFTIGSEITGVAIDTTNGANSIVITGSTSETVNFGGGSASAMGRDIFIAKFSPAGSHVFSKLFVFEGNQTGEGVAIDPVGSILLTGNCSFEFNLGGSTLEPEIDDIFVAKFDSGGKHSFSKIFGDAQEFNSQFVHSIASDPAGGPVIAGRFKGNLNFGAKTLNAADGSGYIAKLSATGQHVWSAQFSSTTYSPNVAVDSKGNILVGGEIAPSVDLGGGAIASAGKSDVLAAKLTGDGAHVWSRGFGGTESEIAVSVAAAPSSDHMLLLGWTQGTFDFGNGPLKGSGQHDIFVAKLNP